MGNILESSRCKIKDHVIMPLPILHIFYLWYALSMILENACPCLSHSSIEKENRRQKSIFVKGAVCRFATPQFDTVHYHMLQKRQCSNSQQCRNRKLGSTRRNFSNFRILNYFIFEFLNFNLFPFSTEAVGQVRMIFQQNTQITPSTPQNIEDAGEAQGDAREVQCKEMRHTLMNFLKFFGKILSRDAVSPYAYPASSIS